MRIKVLLSLFVTLMTVSASTSVFAQAGAAPAEGASNAAAPAPAGSPPPSPAAAATETGATSAPGATVDAATPDSANRVVQLKALEQRVNELKEKIFRSKARLNLLKETVLHGVIAGSRAVIKHRNDMGSSFRLVRLVYAVDGAQIYAKSDDTGGLDDKREFEIFNGSIVPGNHTVSVQMTFRGHGYGIFSYLKGYQFTVRSSHTFTAGEGRQTVLTVKAYEQGNMTTELKDRPAVKFETQLYSTGKGSAQ